MSISKISSILYKIAKFLGDFNAIRANEKYFYFYNKMNNKKSLWVYYK